METDISRTEGQDAKCAQIWSWPCNPNQYHTQKNIIQTGAAQAAGQLQQLFASVRHDQRPPCVRTAKLPQGAAA
jgi:hypothetical protein